MHKTNKSMSYVDTHVLLAPSDWESFQTHPQEKAVRLAKNNKVLYVNRSPRYIQTWGLKGKQNYVYRLLNRDLRKIHNNLYVVTPPPMLPLQFSIISRYFPDQIARKMIRLSKELLLLSIKYILKKLDWKVDYLWMWFPYDAHLVGRLSEKRSIYRTFDEVGEFPSSREIKDIIEELDVQMCRKVDYVICSAKSQYDKRRNINPATYFIPFGVNFKHFNSALNDSVAKPCDWSAISGKKGIIGYAGCIDWRFDFDLMEKLASSNKELAFVLIGPYRDYGFKTLERLCRNENVFWLGEKPFGILPNYVAYFDVGILPYKVGPDTNSMRVYKVFEYLACGKPVVSTNLYEVKQMGGVINIASDFAEFQKLIYASLEFTGDPDAIRERMAFAQGLDWDNIYQQFARTIGFNV